MPTALMLLGGFVLVVVGLASTAICFINPSFIVNNMTTLAFKVFGVMGVIMIGVGWILDRFDH